MAPSLDALKQAAAQAAIAFVPDDAIIGVGTGSTANYFIAALDAVKGRIRGTVASSEATAKRLRELHIPVLDLNTVQDVPIYVDGADEINRAMHMIKGGGGALTREKIVAAVAKQFICIADETKLVERLGKFPLPVEVIPMAQSYVAREIVKHGGRPVLRGGFVTDNGNVILDVHDLRIDDAPVMEAALNQITGVVTVGLFARRPANVLLLGTATGVQTFK